MYYSSYIVVKITVGAHFDFVLRFHFSLYFSLTFGTQCGMRNHRSQIMYVIEKIHLFNLT
eukprot:UN07571